MTGTIGNLHSTQVDLSERWSRFQDSLEFFRVESDYRLAVCDNEWTPKQARFPHHQREELFIRNSLLIERKFLEGRALCGDNLVRREVERMQESAEFCL
jgi:hypothetical protein